MNARTISTMTIAVGMLSFAAGALEAAAGFKENAKETKPALNVRYRFETVDQTGFDEEAGASTARLRFGWVMPRNEGLSIGVQADHVSRLGAEDYNSTDNGRTEFPVIADPTGFDVNQAFVRYRNGPVTVTAGRQRIAHGRQTFVSFKAWRQNEQSFDALRIQASGDQMSLDYAYVVRVNRIFGPRDGAQPGAWSSDSHLLRVSLTPADGHSLGAFTYLLDFDNDNGPANSNATFGLDYAGVFGAFGLAASLGRQWDWAEQPVQYEAPYYAVEARWTHDTTKLSVGWEALGSDGGVAVQTPLGAEHIYRGWTDKFAAWKPGAGLRDTYFSASTKIAGVTLATALHRFGSWNGGQHYGSEAGVSAAYSWERLSILLKLSRYWAEQHATHTTKTWFMLAYSL